uniref:Uncharacterized protein n=1 Tax=Rhizophora mucronata TaxID=61149 RepID=A0A2P2QRB9_RHIMU
MIIKASTLLDQIKPGGALKRDFLVVVWHIDQDRSFFIIRLQSETGGYFLMFFCFFLVSSTISWHACDRRLLQQGLHTRNASWYMETQRV